MPHLMQPRSRRRRTRADPWGQGGAALGVHTGPRPGSRCKAFDHADTHHTRQPFSHRIGKPNGRAGIWVGLPRVGRLERCPCAQVIPHPDDINGFVERSQKPRIWRRGIDVTVAHGVDSMAMAMSLVASTRGLALMPAGRPTSHDRRRNGIRHNQHLTGSQDVPGAAVRAHIDHRGPRRERRQLRVARVKRRVPTVH